MIWGRSMGDFENEHLEKLIIVSCGKAKVWDRSASAATAVPAKDAYSSSLFKLCRRYAESEGCVWMILSAKYGFLHPSQLISNYNISFGQSDEAITTEELRTQWSARCSHVRQLCSLAGASYNERLAQVVPANVSIECPLRGMNLFQRMRFLSRGPRQNRT